MKRSLSSALSGNDYELRNNKTKRINYFRKEEFAVLECHDVLNNIFGFLRKLNLMAMWFQGKVLIMESKFDDGDLFLRQFVYNKEFANTCFLHWHGFLKDVVMLKSVAKMNHLTIQKCTYWSKSREGVHSWESFHRANFIISDDMDFSDEDLDN